MTKIKLYRNDIKLNKDGNVYKFLDISKKFPKIDEVYFSSIKYSKIKAWKKNKTSRQFIYIFEGKIKFIIYDDRDKNKKKIHKFILGKNQRFSKILIPKNVLYGFKGLNKKNILINALEKKHKKCKLNKLEKNNKIIPIIGRKF